MYQRDDVMNMVNMNNSGTLVGPPCGMMDGSKIRPSLQYGWNGWFVNMLVHTRVDLCGRTQIEVTLGNGPKISREGRFLVGYFFTQDIFVQ